MMRPGGFDALPGGGQIALAFEPGGKAEARVGRIRISAGGLLEARPGEGGLAQAMVLLGEGKEQGGVTGRQVARLLEGAFGERKVQFGRGRQTAFEPEMGDAGEATSQRDISSKRLSRAAGGELLARLLPAGGVGFRKGGSEAGLCGSRWRRFRHRGGDTEVAAGREALLGENTGVAVRRSSEVGVLLTN